MELNSRCIQILREAIREPKGIGLIQLLARLQITRRALYYDLPKINQWLELQQLGAIEISGGRVTLHNSDPQKIEQLLGSYQLYHYSVEERRALEILWICLSAEPVTIEMLQTLLDVSRNTVLGDIKEIKSMLEAYRLTIETTGKKGYQISGDEVAIRKLIGQQIYLLENEYPKSVLYGLFQSSLATLTGNHGADFRQMVIQSVQEYEQNINTCLVLSEIDYEVAMILSACIRCIKGHAYKVPPQEKEALKNTREYGAVLVIVRKLHGLFVYLSDDETYYIAILFLGIKNFDFNSAAAENSYIQNFSVNLIHNFERIACVTFSDKRQFLNRLCQHTRPMYYRLKYGIRVTNPLLEHIQTEYNSIYHYTRRAVELTRGELGSLITQEELAYLAVYMASYLSKATESTANVSRRVLIICGAGVAASVLLREQLTQLLGDLFEYQLSPAPRVAGENLRDYYLIVTTVPMGVEQGNIIQTGPILSEENKDQIIRIILESNLLDGAAQEAEDILEVVQSCVPVPDQERLLRELQRYTIKRAQMRSQPQNAPTLQELVQRGSLIRLSDTEVFSMALQQAGETLDPKFARAYAEEMVFHLRLGGSIYEICPGIALEYCCRPRATEVNVGVLVFPKKPARFGRHNIHILVTLQTVDNLTHYPLLDQIYRYFSDPQLCTILRAAATEAEAHRLLQEWMESIDRLPTPVEQSMLGALEG